MDTNIESEPTGASGTHSPDSISHESQQPVAGKLRKSAFKFFGGRRSICVLPNFFGGRSRGLGKGPSKASVPKSQTYDGVSRACWEEGGRGGGDVASGDFEFRSPNGSGEKTTENQGRSQSLPRQKRGLRGLFSSIRKHKKNKNVEADKNEPLEMCPSTHTHNETVPDAPVSVSCRGDAGNCLGGVVEQDVPTAANSRQQESDGSSAAECTKAESLVPEKRRSEEGVVGEEERRIDGEVVEVGEEKKGVLTLYRQPLCAESELARLAEQTPDGLEGEPPIGSTASSDPMSLIFADVSSLKSFDSLTGCGDIIADQDDVSVAESSASGERSGRNAGKRSSCFVTYQGGGEEMATPDEVDGEYLQCLWEADASNEVCYLQSEGTGSLSITPEQLLSSLQHDTSNSSHTQSSPSGVTETARTPGDLLTPQSDRQESVPNSDEGYYDSTTPGGEEDARDRPHPEGLPRDSYSGDALYELYEPDDRLISPSLPPKVPHGLLGEHLQSAEAKGNPLYALATIAMETGAMETEEERLSKIQHALLCCELQSLRSPSKEAPLFRGDPQELLVQRVCRSPQGSEGLSCNGGKSLNSPLHGPACDSGFSPLVSKSPSPSQESVPCGPREQHTALPLLAGESPLLAGQGCSQSQEELMVCFSQALMDFTKNARFYRNSTESLGGSESSSPFGQSLNALPAIVTFDVVDMENEEECERQTELGEEEEEEMVSPYEPFEEEEDDDDNCYLQQDAFAECDQRTLDAYEQSLLLGNSWGMASLPRHLSLGRPCPPVPGPLSLNRRSRSLDTDRLELQTGELYSARTPQTPKRRNGPRSAHEPRPDQDLASLALPWREGQNGWRQGCGHVFDLAQKPAAPPSQQSLVETRSAAVRPSHLPLQLGAAQGRAAPWPRGSCAREGGVLAEGGEAIYPGSYQPGGPQAGWKTRPVGVTQGVPHFHSDTTDDNQRELSVKSRRGLLEAGMSAALPKRTM